MKLYYRIYNEVRADGGENWYADKWHPAVSRWNLLLLAGQLLCDEYGWQPMKSPLFGEPKPIGETEAEARTHCEQDAAEVARIRAMRRAARIVSKNSPILLIREVEWPKEQPHEVLHRFGRWSSWGAMPECHVQLFICYTERLLCQHCIDSSSWPPSCCAPA